MVFQGQRFVLSFDLLCNKRCETMHSLSRHLALKAGLLRRTVREFQRSKCIGVMCTLQEVHWQIRGRCNLRICVVHCLHLKPAAQSKELLFC